MSFTLALTKRKKKISFLSAIYLCNCDSCSVILVNPVDNEGIYISLLIKLNLWSRSGPPMAMRTRSSKILVLSLQIGNHATMQLVHHYYYKASRPKLTIWNGGATLQLCKHETYWSLVNVSLTLFFLFFFFSWINSYSVQ